MRKLALGLLALFVMTEAHDARAFAHVVRKGESLADLAVRVYGDAKLEVIIADVNALDVQGGSAIVPGMRLEIPAPWYHRVVEGETWASMAREFLGDDRRSDMLARMNDAVAWVPPSPGLEIRVPFVVTHIAAPGTTSVGLAGRYLGDPNRGWEIDSYNDRKGKPSRGEVILVALPHLALTNEGKREAQAAEALQRTEAAGVVLDAQKRVEAELPSLASDVRGGRYIDAIARGNRLLGSSELSRSQLATIHRALVDAYVALDAHGAAATACQAWRKNEPTPTLDPIFVSPKVRAACEAR